MNSVAWPVVAGLCIKASRDLLADEVLARLVPAASLSLDDALRSEVRERPLPLALVAHRNLNCNAPLLSSLDAAPEQFGQDVLQHLRVTTSSSMEDADGDLLLLSAGDDAAGQPRGAKLSAPETSGGSPHQGRQKRPRRALEHTGASASTASRAASPPAITARTVLYLYLIEARRRPSRADALHAAYALSLPASFNLPLFWGKARVARLRITSARSSISSSQSFNIVSVLSMRRRVSLRSRALRRLARPP